MKVKRKVRADDYNARLIARAWLDRGVRTIPITKGTKRPRGEDWEKLRLDDDNIDGFFKLDDAVGALWGKPSDGVCDVDLDWDEAAVAARRLLPATYTYGRTKRPRTHYLYRITGDGGSSWRTTKWRFDREVIVELRGTKSQSLVPPSTHPAGQYTVDEDRDFESIERHELDRLLGCIAAVALLARQYPDGGGRHDFICALAGALKREGRIDREIRAICGALLDAVGSREDDREQRERTVESTLKSEAEVYGWKTLIDSIGGSEGVRVIEQVKKWLKVKAKSEGAGGEIAVPDRVVRSETDAAAYNEWRGGVPGGLVGEIAHWAGRRSFVHQPLFDLAVGLMCTAIATRNKYVVEGWETPLQPYFMLAAPTGAGKENALESVYQFARRARLGNNVYSGFQSYHSLLDRLAETRSAVWLWDEAARKMKAASRSMSSPDFALVTHLLSMYGKAATSVAGLPARGQPIPEIERPFLTVMAASQPAPLVDAISASEVVVGLINRFILFDAGDGAGVDNVRRDAVFPARIEKEIERLREESVRGGENMRLVKWADAKVYQRMVEFQRWTRDKAAELDAEGLNPLWSRAAQNAMMLAGIVAIGMRDRITMETCDWATGLSRWSVERWVIRLGKGMVRNPVEGYSLRVEELIRSAEALAGKGKRPKQRELMRRGLMPRAMLSLMMRHLTSRQLEEAMLALIDSGLIAEGEEEGCKVYWPLND